MRVLLIQIIATEAIGTMLVLVFSCLALSVTFIHWRKLLSVILPILGLDLMFKGYYSSNPLCDGAGCGATNGCCEFKNPLLFHSSLPQATSDDVEVHLCFSSPSYEEDIIVYLLEIYVQP